MSLSSLVRLDPQPATLAPDSTSPMSLAFLKACEFIGATSPNPPVGAVITDRTGKVLTAQAHAKAGEMHAEAKAIHDLQSRGLLDQAHTIYVTLEPCNHTGRTPPCAEAILNTPIQNVIFAVPDPNPTVPGKGAERLQSAGRVVSLCPNSNERIRCEKLLLPFRCSFVLDRPWMVVKTALRNGSMIPPPGEKTFTSAGALDLAHQLRKESDAIITGSGTILADSPLLNVRRVPDFPGKKRYLVVCDRRARTPQKWVNQAISLGFEVQILGDYTEAIDFLREKKVHQALVEAGPTLSQSILGSRFWGRHVVIDQAVSDQGFAQETITERWNTQLLKEMNVFWNY